MQAYYILLERIFTKIKVTIFTIWKAVIMYLEGGKAQRVDRDRCFLFLF
jgi:hypothetical protein